MTLKRLVHYRQLTFYSKIRPVTGVNKERMATAKSIQESSTGCSKHGANLECYKKQMFAWEVKSLLQKFVSLLQPVNFLTLQVAMRHLFINTPDFMVFKYFSRPFLYSRVVISWISASICKLITRNIWNWGWVFWLPSFL